MPFFLFCHLRKLVFHQSSPVYLVSESRGGGLSVTEEENGRSNERTEILLSNIGYKSHATRPQAVPEGAKFSGNFISH